MSLLLGAFTIGLILALLALGIFISFRIFNFADITAEGSITLGASIAASMIAAGFNPVIATLVALLGGFIAGALTGIIHTKFDINGLLSGILVMTALYSINLHVMGKSNVPLLTEKTTFSYFEEMNRALFPGADTVKLFGSTVPEKDIFILASVFIIVLIIAILLYFPTLLLPNIP